MSSSIPPPAGSSGNARYAVIGLLLLLGAGVAIYFATRPGPTPPQQQTDTRPSTTTPDASVEQRTGPQIAAQIELPPEEPDAGEVGGDEDGGTSQGNRVRIRYVTRYVSACPGTVDPNRVAAVVRNNYGGLRECYNRQLRLDPTLRGRVTAQWIINTNGSVGQISTSGPVTRNRAFKSCFEGALSRLRFSPPTRGCATFEQSFSFTPGE